MNASSDRVMWKAVAILVARLIFAAVFIMAAGFKYADMNGTAGDIASAGVPIPLVLAWLAAPRSHAADSRLVRIERSGDRTTVLDASTPIVEHGDVRVDPNVRTPDFRDVRRVIVEFTALPPSV